MAQSRVDSTLKITNEWQVKSASHTFQLRCTLCRVDDASRTVTDLLSDSPHNNSPGGGGGGWKGRVLYDTEGGGAGEKIPAAEKVARKDF